MRTIALVLALVLTAAACTRSSSSGSNAKPIDLSLKNAFLSVSQVGKIANKVVSRLKDVLAGKVHASPLPSSDGALLPPPGPDMTLLGSVRLPIEAVVVMLGFSSPEALAGILHSDSVDSIVFGDYALDNDTHVEVRAGLLDFSTTQNANDWIDALRGTASVDSSGIATFYDDASGQCFSLFTAGAKGRCSSAVRRQTSRRHPARASRRSLASRPRGN